MRVRLGAAAVGVVLIAAGVLGFSLASHPAVAGSNGIQPLADVVFLRGGVRHCQQLPSLPARVSRLKFLVSRTTGGAQALDVLLVGPEGRIAGGHIRQVPAGFVTVRLDHPTPDHGVRHAGVCLTNPDGGMIVLSGETKRCTPRDTGIGVAAPCAHGAPPNPPDQTFRWLVGIRFLRHGSTSWLSQANVILDRFRLAQAGWFGTWAAWVAGVFAFFAAALGLWWLVRQPQPEP